MKRITSVDIFRALTMLLMIFVNDLWTLHDIPGWLEHTKAHEDGMGLADVVFPAFLFIVGLSIPFAIDARIRKGDSRLNVLVHIIKRALALVVMGFFMVNLESFLNDVNGSVRTAWQLLMALAFVLIWNHYESRKVFSKIPVISLQLVGILMLFFLAAIYKGGTPEAPHWMRPHWWGILGIIGWAYLLCAVVYLIMGSRIWLMVIFWLILHVLNVQEFVKISDHLPSIRLVVSASHHALVMSGVLATLFYKHLNEKGKISLFTAVLGLLALVSIAYGFTVRPFWGISKILATPSWTAICAGIGFAFFAVMYLIADILTLTGWASFIMPAGRSTLTCYLIPYFVYPAVEPLLHYIPRSLSGGVAGLVKSLIFALLVVWITGLLENVHVKLKI
jgi:predicted acyltransferase